MIHEKMAYREEAKPTLLYMYRGDRHEHEIENVTHLYSNMMSGNPIKAGNVVDVEAMSQELEELASHSSTNNAFAHFVISLPPGESLSPAEWCNIVEGYLKAMGYSEHHKSTSCLHHEKQNEHAHICACRIDPDPLNSYCLVNDSLDYWRGMEYLRDKEKELGLTIVPMPHETDNLTITKEEYKVISRQMDGDIERGRSELVRHKVAAMVDDVLKKAAIKPMTLRKFAYECTKKDIAIQVTMNEQDYPIGIRYTYNNATFKGSQLKKTKHTLQSLTGYGYDEKAGWQRLVVKGGMLKGQLRKHQNIMFDQADRDFFINHGSTDKPEKYLQSLKDVNYSSNAYIALKIDSSRLKSLRRSTYSRKPFVHKRSNQFYSLFHVSTGNFSLEYYRAIELHKAIIRLMKVIKEFLEQFFGIRLEVVGDDHLNEFENMNITDAHTNQLTKNDVMDLIEGSMQKEEQKIEFDSNVALKYCESILEDIQKLKLLESSGAESTLDVGYTR